MHRALALNRAAFLVCSFVSILANLCCMARLRLMLPGQSTRDNDPNYTRPGADAATMGVHSRETAEEGG